MTVEEVRGSLDSTDNGAVKNSIRNCLTVFQNDPKLEGAIRYNILTERIDIVKPLWWSKPTTTLNDTDLNYLMLYLEDQYTLTSEKKIQKAISIVADCNKYHPIVPFPVSWTVKMKKKQKETQDILSYHTQAAGCSDKARAKASGGRQPIEECGRTGL